MTKKDKLNVKTYERTLREMEKAKKDGEMLDFKPTILSIPYETYRGTKEERRQ